MQKHLPSNVRRFEQLAYLAIGLFMIQVPFEWKKEWNRIAAETNPSFALLAGLSFFAMLVMLVWQAAREHKNWARWVLLVLAVVSLPLAFQSFDPTTGFSVIAGTLRFCELLTWGAALFFAFTGNARSWFEKCATCGAPRYAGGSSFCARCGAAFVVGRQRQSYSAPPPSSGWSGIPFFVRLAIYIVCVPIVIGGLFWALLFFSIAIRSMK